MSRLSVSGAIVGLLSAAEKITASLRPIAASRDSFCWEGEEKSIRELVGKVFEIYTLLTSIQNYTNSNQGIRKAIKDGVRFVLLEHVVIILASVIMTFSEIDAFANGLEVQENGGFDRTAWEAAQYRVHTIANCDMMQQKSCLKLISDLMNGCGIRKRLLHWNRQRSILELCDRCRILVELCPRLATLLQRMKTNNNETDDSCAWVRPHKATEDDIDVNIRLFLAENTRPAVLKPKLEGGDDLGESRNPKPKSEERYWGILQCLVRLFEKATPRTEVYLRAKYEDKASLKHYPAMSTTAFPIFSSQSVAECHEISTLLMPITAADITNSSYYVFGLRADLPLHIFYRTLQNKTVYTEITETTTCLELKRIIFSSEGTPVTSQDLISTHGWRGTRWISDDDVLFRIGFGRGERIEVLMANWGFRKSEQKNENKQYSDGTSEFGHSVYDGLRFMDNDR